MSAGDVFSSFVPRGALWLPASLRRCRPAARIPARAIWRLRYCAYDPTQPMTTRAIRKPWAEVRKASGLEWFRPHDCRHTAITRWAEAGVPIPTIMSIAGHISRRMSEHYTRVTDAAKREAIAATYPNSTHIPKPPVKQAANVVPFVQRTQRSYL